MLTKEEAKKNLSVVIERFKRWKELGRLNNEEDVKTLIYELSEKVLGWDIDDIYRERHPGPTSKRADFQFKDKGVIKLILETKAFDVSWDRTIIRQTIGYGWSANKEYVILTNFQTLILFNAKWKDEDKKIFEIENIEDCLTSEQKFDFLWLLSKESFLTGKIDEFSESIGKKLKKLEVFTIDKHLLNDLKKWREILTKDIKSLNELPEYEVDEVIQKIINRLIFIRVCEDRGLEPEFAELRSHLNIWSEKRNKPLTDVINFVFHHYDDAYDSNIFQKNDLCEKVKICNKILEKIIEELYIAKDVNIEYNFASIDADVLGYVYEEYLGYLLKGKKITENNVHRKEQGIYYTPTYIVDYIVRNTLGELIKNKKVDIEKIRVLDSACGSGSFLIKAFDILNEHYSKNEHYDQTTLDTKSLTTFKTKERILKNNIFGVDLDKQAVEIAQLNLLLKIAEKGHRLPLLQENIKCGNSLIDDEKIAGDKAFKWEEKFKEIMNDGGFDIIIGNPPWGAKIDNQIKEYYLSHYKSVNREIESHILFIELSLRLIKEGGLLGFIVPNTWMYLFSTESIRKTILSNCEVVSIIELTKYIFADAPDIVPVIIILKKSISNKSKNIIKVLSFSDKNSLKSDLFLNLKYKMIKQKDIEANMSKIFNLNLISEIKNLLGKIRTNSKELSEVVKTNYGIKTGNNEKYILNHKLDTNFKKCLKTKEIGRYRIEWKQLWLNYGSHLAGYRKDSLEVPKIIVQYIRKLSLKRRLVCAFDKNGEYYPLNNYSYIIGKEDLLKFILGIINSKLMNFYFANTFIDYNIKPTYINKLPIRGDIESSKRNKLIILVSKIIELNEKLIKLKDKSTNEKIRIEEEIKKIDVEIDEIVYNIYDITEKEKKIIEESLN